MWNFFLNSPIFVTIVYALFWLMVLKNFLNWRKKKTPKSLPAPKYFVLYDPRDEHRCELPRFEHAESHWPYDYSSALLSTAYAAGTFIECAKCGKRYIAEQTDNGTSYGRRVWKETDKEVPVIGAT